MAILSVVYLDTKDTDVLPMIDPSISLKANIETNHKIEACIPMNENQHVENDFRNSECIWKTCPCFSFIKEFNHSVESEYSVETDNYRTGNLFVTAGTECKVGKVCWEDTENIHDIVGILQIIFP